MWTAPISPADDSRIILPPYFPGFFPASFPIKASDDGGIEGRRLADQVDAAHELAPTVNLMRRMTASLLYKIAAILVLLLGRMRAVRDSAPGARLDCSLAIG